MKSTVLIIQECLLAGLCSAILSENSRGVSQCCFDFYPKRLPIKALATYKITSSMCHRRAVIFSTRGGKEICADAKLAWVKSHVKILDALSKFNVKKAPESSYSESEIWNMVPKSTAPWSIEPHSTAPIGTELERTGHKRTEPWDTETHPTASQAYNTHWYSKKYKA